MSPTQYKTVNGKIRLTRENSKQTAAFSLVHASLSELEDQLQSLHPKEIATSQNHKFEARKKAFLLGRLAGREALSLLMTKEKRSTVFIDNGVLSFPIIEGASGGLGISISHCDDIGMALVHPQGHPMAIDIERLIPKIDAFQDKLTTQERSIIRKEGLPKVIGYPMAWTIKESLSKILRTGMTLDFRLIEMETIHRKGNYYESTFVNFGQYKAISYLVDYYVCSIVLPKFTTPELEEFENGIQLLDGIKPST